jgi:predicted enzyme related to lactoylglutathione lyase
MEERGTKEMKITSFNPLIATKDPESVIQLFEALGFERRHTKKGISDQDMISVRMKDSNGFYVDVTKGEFPDDRTIIRMNVDDLEQTIELLERHGFTPSKKFNGIIETPSSRFILMVSPSGFVFDIIQHIKNREQAPAV